MSSTSAVKAPTFLNFVNGEWVPAKSGDLFENRNPAHKDEVIGLFPKSAKADVEEAVRAARSAFDAWRRTPAPVRGEILKRVGDLLVARKEEIARDMTREMGKVLAETRGDAQEGIDTAYYALGEGRRLFGETVPSELPDKFAMTVREPLGVAGVITPWNFPLAIPTWKMFPALLAGNTVVFKPASDVPLTASHLVHALVDAGVPPKVVNLVHGGGGEVGTAIADHPDVPVVSFTGSTAVGRTLAERCGRGLKRLSLELGGKNAQIVLDDAEIDLALEGALWGAFGTTGQRCTATSRIILQEGIHDRFVERLAERASRLVLGDGLDPKSQVGPLVNGRQLQTVAEYVDIGKREGARLVCGGEAATSGALADGWFYKPTLFAGVTRSMRIAREEIFGPVVSILKVADLDEAIATLNDTVYGLSSSIYTRDVNAAFRAMRDIQAGITYVNGPTIGAEAHLPFGGVKETGNGHREGGWTAYEIFTEYKTIYVDYSGKLQRAQIDNR
jgi:aldehyde dehydrogenase (NAD+)